MDSSNCLSYKRLVILHKLRCANCVTKILYFFHTTKLSVPDFSNFCLHTDFLFCPEFSNYRIFVFTRSIADSHGFFFSCPELSNYRIFVFTRNIADSHGFFFFFFSCPELSNFNHTEYRGRSRIFFPRIIELSNFIFLSRDLSFVPNFRIIEFLSSVTFRDTPCD